MCMLKAASAAISLTKEAIRSDAVVRDPELQRCLSDLLVHLRVWQVESVAMVHSRPAAADAEDADEPTAIVGG